MKPKTLEALTLKDFVWTDKKKDGSLCMTKGGTSKDGKTIPSKPFYMCNLTCEEYAVRLYGMSFGAKEDIEKIKVGDKIELIVFEEEYQGRTNLKFEFPTSKSANEAKLKALEEKFGKMEKEIKELKETFKTGLAQLKSDICLELTGKVQTTKDLEKYNEPHPLVQLDTPDDGIPLDVYDNDNF